MIGNPKYRPGGLVLAPEDLKRDEDEVIAAGEKPTAILDIGVWTRGFEEIDLFNWQQAVANMISVSELEIELATSEGLIRRAIERGDVRADHTLTLGDRVYHYFAKESVDEICDKLGIEKVGIHNIKERFVEFVKKMEMAASYKPVMMLAILELVNEKGCARLTDVVMRFKSFYTNIGRRLAR